MKILSSLKTSFFSKFVANTNWTTFIHIVTLCHTVPYSSTVRNCVISNSFFKRTYPGLFLHFSHACLFHTWLADVRMWTTNFHPCLFRYVPNTDNVKNVKYFSELCSLLTSTAVTTASTTSRRLHHGGLEERIQRAKAKVQNGLLHMGSGSSISSSSSSSLSAFAGSGPASMTLPNGVPPTGHRVKLSTRFQTAQKLNYKLAALSSFSTRLVFLSSLQYKFYLYYHTGSIFIAIS